MKKGETIQHPSLGNRKMNRGIQAIDNEQNLNEHAGYTCIHTENMQHGNMA